jgi:hypothetical protein
MGRVAVWAPLPGGTPQNGCSTPRPRWADHGKVIESHETDPYNAVGLFSRLRADAAKHEPRPTVEPRPHTWVPGPGVGRARVTLLFFWRTGRPALCNPSRLAETK